MDIAVIGTGMVGRLIAVELSKKYQVYAIDNNSNNLDKSNQISNNLDRSNQNGNKDRDQDNDDPPQKYKCADIGDWNLAQKLLSQGHSYLDRDKDGEACEVLAN